LEPRSASGRKTSPWIIQTPYDRKRDIEEPLQQREEKQLEQEKEFQKEIGPSAAITF